MAMILSGGFDSLKIQLKKLNLPDDIIERIDVVTYHAEENTYRFAFKNGYTVIVHVESLYSFESEDILRLSYYAYQKSKHRPVMRLIDVGEGMLVPRGFAEEFDLVRDVFKTEPTFNLKSPWSSQYIHSPDPLKLVEEAKAELVKGIKIYQSLLVDPKHYPIILPP